MEIKSTDTTKIVSTYLHIHLKEEEIKELEREFILLESVNELHYCPTITNFLNGIRKEIYGNK